MRARFYLLLALLAANCATSWGLSIVNSKHDLSVASRTTGPKTTGATETCAFCHTAHRAAANSPLWNRPDSQLDFTFYSSNYLNNYLGQKAPTMTDLKVSKTKLCLSCHDGVTAIGGLYDIVPNTVEILGSLGAGKVIGADLRNQHPVLYDVRPGAGPPTEPGTDPEIRLPPENDPVKVFGPSRRVECSSCHDVHNNQYGQFLVKPNANAALCTTCHQKTNYGLSAHATSNANYTNTDGVITSVREWSCRNCHKVHNASGAQAYLLTGPEEATCYQCHGSPSLPGAKDVKSQFARGFTHPTEAVFAAHVNPELDGSNLGLGKRHAECWDCHNPHQAKAGSHTPPTNQISNALLGQWGVEPNWGGAAWTTAMTYLRQVFTNTSSYKEYQLCLKCHSSYAFGQTPPLGGTDIAVELNPNNRSAHPVRAGLNSQTGSASPQGLTSAQLSAPFASNPGNQTMACSDCHGSDVASDPQGPHGSSGPRLLKGPAKFWPVNASGNLWALNDVKDNANNWSRDLFCVNCHPLSSKGEWKNNAHKNHEGKTLSDGKGMRCIFCHTAVPHGSQRGRLIGYAADLPPYNYNGPSDLDRPQLSGFKKASGPNNYTQLNCYSTTVSCHDKHGVNNGSYDP